RGYRLRHRPDHRDLSQGRRRTARHPGGRRRHQESRLVPGHLGRRRLPADPARENPGCVLRRCLSRSPCPWRCARRRHRGLEPRRPHDHARSRAASALGSALWRLQGTLCSHPRPDASARLGHGRANKTRTSKIAAEGEDTMRYELMLPHQIRTAIDAGWPVVLPLGVLEYHGEHLAVGMDTLAVTRSLELVEPEMQLVILPAFHYGAASYAVEKPEGNCSVQVY